MAKALSSPSNYPDVIICGMFNNLNDADYAALGLYLQRGGVLFLMTESTSTALRTWFRNTLSSATLTTPRQDGSGAVYKINNIDPDVLNGVFGDARGKYWGQDRSSTQYMENINPNDIVAYTGGSVNFASRTGVTMFRHKTLNLFFVGDTGFLANRLNDGSEERDTAYPFATVGGSGPDMHFPTSTPYGRRSATGSLESGRAAGSWQVENGVIFGNVFAWLLERSHFAGVNRTP